MSVSGRLSRLSDLWHTWIYFSYFSHPKNIMLKCQQYYLRGILLIFTQKILIQEPKWGAWISHLRAWIIHLCTCFPLTPAGLVVSCMYHVFATIEVPKSLSKTQMWLTCERWTNVDFHSGKKQPFREEVQYLTLSLKCVTFTDSTGDISVFSVMHLYIKRTDKMCCPFYFASSQLELVYLAVYGCVRTFLWKLIPLHKVPRAIETTSWISYNKGEEVLAGGRQKP